MKRFLLCVLLVITLVGCSSETSNSTVLPEVTRDTNTASNFEYNEEMHVVAEITSGSWRRGWLIYFDTSECLYIFNDGCYTPYLKSDGSVMTRAEYEELRK